MVKFQFSQLRNQPFFAKNFIENVKFHDQALAALLSFRRSCQQENEQLFYFHEHDLKLVKMDLSENQTFAAVMFSNITIV